MDYWGKHKRKMVVQGIELTGKQPAAMEIHHWFHSTDTRLHYYYIGSLNYDLSIVVTDYHSYLFLMGTF